ncbi:6124_t:CDS:2, partial [Acaulospora colombiana]
VLLIEEDWDEREVVEEGRSVEIIAISLTLQQLLDEDLINSKGSQNPFHIYIPIQHPEIKYWIITIYHLQKNWTKTKTKEKEHLYKDLIYTLQENPRQLPFNTMQ